jgi:hypothetical protein
MATKKKAPTEQIQMGTNLDFSLKILFGNDFGLIDLDILETLSTGMFGRTRLVKSLKDRKFYSLKIMKKARVVKMGQLKHIQSEAMPVCLYACMTV